jgi:chaperone required for assembly of F1-ATPase
VVIALAVSDGRLDAAEAFQAAQTDELYQIDRWGDDPTAEKQREGVRQDIAAGARFLSLLENARMRG